MPLRSAILPILPKRAQPLDFPILPFLAPRVFQPWPFGGRHNSHNYSTVAAPSPSKTQSAEQAKDDVTDIAVKELSPIATEQEWKAPSVAFPPASHTSRTRRRTASDDNQPGIAKGLSEQPIGRAPRGSPRRLFLRPTDSGRISIQKSKNGPICFAHIGPRPPARTRFRSMLKRDPIGLPGRRTDRAAYLLRFSTKLKVERIGKFVSGRLSYRLYNSRPGLRHAYQRNGHQPPDPSTRLLEMNYEGNFIRQFRWLERDQSFKPTLFDEKLLSGSSESLKEEWEKLDFQEKGLTWPRLMFLALACYPSKILKFINTTYCAPYPSSAAVCDSLDFVILHYLKDLEPSHKNYSVYLYKTIINMLLRGPANYTYLSQNAIYYLLIRLPSPEYVVDLYRSLERLNNPLRPWTLAHFASRLSQASHEYEEIVFEMLQRLGDLRTDFNTPMMESLCTTILLNSSPDANIGHSEKFEYMLKCGLIPNIITYNVLLLKNLRAGDRIGSWRIFELMNESGPEPDAYTYSTLLNDAKRRGDTLAIKDLMESFNRKGMSSAHVVVDVLHSTLMSAESAKRRSSWGPVPVDRSAFREMLPYYCRHFHFEPLARLVPGLATNYPQYMGRDQTETSLGSVNLSSIRAEPPKHALVVMLTALLRGYEDPDTPKWFYEHWRKLVHDCDPFILEISTANNGHYLSVIYNSLLKSLGRHAINVPLCLKILGEMSKSLPVDSNAETAIRLPKPTIATWNILAELLMQHRQPRAAEKILSMMRERGIVPTYVTWRNLLKGYVRMRDVGMVVNTVDRQERAGFPVSSSILREMKTVSDRRALIEGLKVAEMVRLEDTLREREREREREVNAHKMASNVAEHTVEEVEPERLVVEDMPLPGPADANSQLAKVFEGLKGKEPVEEQRVV
ncbi:hypothetical protein HYFRA_00007745 [Hymenoscyphus fraxineus]|uniref:Pentatricopeptide repeat protein n=1 Tax=Hymenoscyphus fraxineus TaxID=746836 RepID=A0A9N9KP23_9HELO|nr:hypothetical protein HYFRA_00007745 [Hymenoscyphus fraxineus]